MPTSAQPRQISVLFTIAPPPELREHMARAFPPDSGVHLLFPSSPREEAEALTAELIALAPQAELMVGWRVEPEVLAAAGKLKQYIFAGVGAQSVLGQLREINQRQPVTLVKSIANTYATAQHAVGLLLVLLNRIVPHHNWMAEGLWRRGDDYAQSATLRGRLVGLLGYGAVNRNVHRFLAGFDVNFAILRRTWEGEPELELPTPAERFDEAQLESFLDAVDTLFVGVPLTTRTRGMLGAAELARLGARGVLVNVARGGVVDEAALYEALRDKVIAGAALDVWYVYRPEADAAGRRYPYDPAHPFHELTNVVLSPHRAASPVFDLSRWDEVVELIRRFQRGDAPLNVVDLQREY